MVVNLYLEEGITTVSDIFVCYVSEKTLTMSVADKILTIYLSPENIYREENTC